MFSIIDDFREFKETGKSNITRNYTHQLSFSQVPKIRYFNHKKFTIYGLFSTKREASNAVMHLRELNYYTRVVSLPKKPTIFDTERKVLKYAVYQRSKRPKKNGYKNPNYYMIG